MAINKEDQQAKFVGAQLQISSMLKRVPAGCQNWSIQKTMTFKKLIKESEKFIKLKPTDDLVQFHKIENHLSNIKKYYSGN